MRTVPNSPFNSVSRMTVTGSTATATAKATFSPPAAAAAVHRSPWHSPVPYLFGGLAAMLGLIAFALLVLACSYWRHSAGEDADRRGGDAEKGEGAADAKGVPVFEEKFLVIMAGEVKPTFLATPMSSKTSSFNGENGNETKGHEENVEKKDETTSSGDEESASSSPAAE